MVSIRTMSSAKAVSHYFKAEDSYYTAERSCDQSGSSWWGRGAEKFGLEGPVEKQDFEQLLSGQLPTGDEIQAGAGGERRPGVDVTISAPKSVSLLAEIGGDGALRDAHERAVTATLSFLQEEGMRARVTQDGVTQTTATDNAIVARFEHNSSRELDPQVHTHCFF